MVISMIEDVIIECVDGITKSLREEYTILFNGLIEDNKLPQMIEYGIIKKVLDNPDIWEQSQFDYFDGVEVGGPGILLKVSKEGYATEVIEEIVGRIRDIPEDRDEQSFLEATCWLIGKLCEMGKAEIFIQHQVHIDLIDYLTTLYPLQATSYALAQMIGYPSFDEVLIERLFPIVFKSAETYYPDCECENKICHDRNAVYSSLSFS